MRYLVTGGLGYLGNHLVAQLVRNSHEVVVLDVRPKADLVYHKQISYVQGDISNLQELQKIDKFFPLDGVFHLAAMKSVEESVRNPSLYFKVNFEGTKNLANFCVVNEISRIVYTSSAAVYGESQESNSVDENCLPAPSNPYGESKLMGEMALYSLAQEEKLSAIALRCFNLVGSEIPYMLNKSDSNILPILVKKLHNRETFEVFGDTHMTKDGSCIRDYVNVHDVARAHILAMDYLENQLDPCFEKINISSGSGTSIFELIGMVESTSGMKLEHKNGPKRSGDPAQVIGDSSLAKNLLKWESKIQLRQSVKETLQAFIL